MKFFQTKPLKIAYAVLSLFVVLLIFLGWNVYNSYSRSVRRGISIDKAQELVPFILCPPTYLPASIKTTPFVIYNASLGDPIDSKVWLQYYGVIDNTLMLEIYYSDAHGTNEYETTRSAENRSTSRYWFSDWASTLYNVELSEDQIRIEETSFAENSIVYWRYEIVEPLSLRATMVEWIHRSTYYRLYSIISPEEAQKTASSINEVCR